jgi:hypothetical protein
MTGLLLLLLLVLCRIGPGSPQNLTPSTAPTTSVPLSRAPATGPPVSRAPITNGPVTASPVSRAVPVTPGPVTRSPLATTVTGAPAGTSTAPATSVPANTGSLAPVTSNTNVTSSSPVATSWVPVATRAPTYGPSSLAPTFPFSMAPIFSQMTILPSVDVDSQLTDPPGPTTAPLPTTSAPVSTAAPTITWTRPPALSLPALKRVQCQESPCVINLSPYTTRTCGDIAFQYNIASDACCVLQDAKNGTCTVTVLGSSASCSISQRLDKQCFAYVTESSGEPAFYCKDSPAILVEWSSTGLSEETASANNNNNTTTTNTTTTCPPTLYNTTRQPPGNISEVPLSTMLFSGAMGIVPSINLGIWAELTRSHILAYYETSVTVQDLLVAIQPYPQQREEETNSTSSSSSSRGNAVVSYHFYGAYRGPGPLVLNDPFHDAIVVRPYLAALRQIGGLIFTNLTGVTNIIATDNNTIMADPPTTAPVPVPTLLSSPGSSSSAGGGGPPSVRSTTTTPDSSLSFSAGHQLSTRHALVSLMALLSLLVRFCCWST